MKFSGRKITVFCDFCGKEIHKYPSKLKKHNFCSRSCLASYSSKSKNPSGYASLKDYTGMSENMRCLNMALNPGRMTPEIRLKLRAARISKSGGCKGYRKFLGRHLHRTVAELALGRELLPGEVVHHIDGDKQNNDYKNLKVFDSQAQHAAWHATHDAKKEGDAV